MVPQKMPPCSFGSPSTTQRRAIGRSLGLGPQIKTEPLIEHRRGATGETVEKPHAGLGSVSEALASRRSAACSSRAVVARRRGRSGCRKWQRACKNTARFQVAGNYVAPIVPYASLKVKVVGNNILIIPTNIAKEQAVAPGCLVAQGALYPDGYRAGADAFLLSLSHEAVRLWGSAFGLSFASGYRSRTLIGGS